MLPLLALRDTVPFPGNVLPLTVGRPASVAALQYNIDNQLSPPELFLLAQKDAAEEEPQQTGLYTIGTVAVVLQMDKVSNGLFRVLVDTKNRCRLDSLERLETGCLLATVTPVPSDREQPDPKQIDALVKAVRTRFNALVEASEQIPDVVQGALSGIDDPERIFNTIANHLYSGRLEERQQLLEISGLAEQLERLAELMEGELTVLGLDRRLHHRVKKQMEKSQREFYLNEQMKAIQKELGEGTGGQDEFEQLEKRFRDSGMPADTLKKSLSELERFKMMSPMSAEASVMRSYLDWLVGVPWKQRSRLRRDLSRARQILDEDHYGLEEVKERILEYLAVQRRVRRMRGPILCLVGPPGVGKTSLGQSIARVTRRQFVRLSLGGVRDEAEIRGHRRTYIGALPGKIIQKMATAGTINPLFLLDEVDKLGMDFRGDPASALLEVLDPEQNHTFSDHYLEVNYNLSEVMFVCTANTTDLPPALLDRMELIRLPGYTEDEKQAIARKYLLPKQMKNSGIRDGELVVSDAAILDLIRYYTREAGVRGLDRELAKICRKVVLAHSGKTKQSGGGKQKTLSTRVGSVQLSRYCGVRVFDYGKGEERNRVGQINGLAWTSAGGELLIIEASMVPGKARQILTGSLGDVMKESIQIAVTVVRNQAEKLGVPSDFLETTDVHVHVPEGATPKDGPSAGVGMCIAVLSALCNIPARSDLAMTGELTLQGRILPVGGLKEKLLAARRAGIRKVLIPEGNSRHLEEIPNKIKNKLDIHCVSSIDEVLPLALERLPKPLKVTRRRSQVRPH